MARTTAPTKTTTASQKPVKAASKRGRLDLATAQQSDGALPSFKSVYDLVGIRDVRYRHATFASYSAWLKTQDLAELHDHAYEFALAMSPSRGVMIDRLEGKYLQENPEQRVALADARRAEATKNPLTIDQQARRILEATG